MGYTVKIQGTEEVLAMVENPGTFYRGKWEKIRVTQVSKDEDTPLKVRESLVGLVIPTIFTKERFEEQTGVRHPNLTNGARLTYVPKVIEALESAGKNEAARQLRKKCPDPLDMYIFEREIYEPIA